MIKIENGKVNLKGNIVTLKKQPCHNYHVH